MNYPCPCCGYLTARYPRKNAIADICPVCFWENDVFSPGEDEPSPAREEDFPAIYELVRTAFQTARVSDGTEQDFVEQLRRREGFSLELVAERGGALMREAAQRAAANAIFLVGDPGYYGRYGFENAVEMGFTNASGVPDQYLLVLPLEFTLRDRAGGAVNLH